MTPGGETRSRQRGLLALPVVRHLTHKPRLLAAILLGVCVLAATLSLTSLRPITDSLLAWNAGTLLYLGLGIGTMMTASTDVMRRRAALYDDGEFTILLLSILAACLSAAAIVNELASVKSVSGILRGAHIGLSVLTLMTSWAFIHTAFAFHYAHGYYFSERHCGDKGERCLIFPGTETPDYLDFLYFSFIIGTSGQTADVSLAGRKTRPISTIHCIVAYVFNATVLALTINIAASLVN
ncbi:MAG: DUF1345 domain-containing protein [Asticcacaulis sp.]|nr:DUF1345 domain-containing protein [Asticcacaulis sp.]